MEVDFLFSNELVNEVEKLIHKSDKYLLLVSPFIDLDKRIQDALAEKLKNPNFKLKVLFGKNKSWNYGPKKADPLDSMKSESREFLLKFPNIEIRYNDRLHAKFYQNDSHFIMTSMNLYGYSLAKNIEVGIISRYGSTSAVGKLADKAGLIVNKGVARVTEKVIGIENDEVDPTEKFRTIFETSELKFRTEPIMKKKSGLMGFAGGEEMDGITILEDTLSRPQKPNTKKEAKAYQYPKSHQKSGVVATPQRIEKVTNTDLKSASQLSKLLGVASNDITKKMEQKGFVREGQLTDAGKTNGLVLKKYMGTEYVAYPTEMIVNEFSKN